MTFLRARGRIENSKIFPNIISTSFSHNTQMTKFFPFSPTPSGKNSEIFAEIFFLHYLPFQTTSSQVSQAKFVRVQIRLTIASLLQSFSNPLGNLMQLKISGGNNMKIFGKFLLVSVHYYSNLYVNYYSESIPELSS